MNLDLELRPTYGSMVNTYVDLSTLWADAPIEIRAQAQEDRLQILKRLEAQAAPDAVVSELPDVQNPQNKQPISEPALHTPDVQDPQNKLQMSEPALIRQMCRILKISSRCLSRLLTLPLNVACVSRSAPQCRLSFPRWHRGKACTSSSPLCTGTVLSPADRINAIPSL